MSGTLKVVFSNLCTRKSQLMYILKKFIKLPIKIKILSCLGSLEMWEVVYSVTVVQYILHNLCISFYIHKTLKDKYVNCSHESLRVLEHVK